MTSFKPSSAVDVRSIAKSCSSSNIHNILNPSQSNTSGEASQRGSDLYPLCRSPRFDSSQVDWTDSLPRQAQTGILKDGSSQISRPQATTLHVASLGRSGTPEIAKAQQYPSTVREFDTMEPGLSPLPPLSYSYIKSKMSTMGARHSLHSQDAGRCTSQYPSDYNSNLSIAPRYGIAAPQQPSLAYQAPTYSASFLTPVALPALSSHDAVGSRAQSGYSIRTPDGLIQIPVDLESGSRWGDEKRKRNAGASARFRQRRKEKELKHAQIVAELEQRVRGLTKICELYREERDHFYNLVKSGADPRI